MQAMIVLTVNFAAFHNLIFVYTWFIEAIPPDGATEWRRHSDDWNKTLSFETLQLSFEKWRNGTKQGQPFQ